MSEIKKYDDKEKEHSKRELKINPKFQECIPEMSDEEFALLEQNILEDGEIREPIIIWGDTIIDGHHRYMIAQKYPEINYKIEEKEFKSEADACLWICKNQLGRRNLTNQKRRYLIGKQQELEKNAHGGGQEGNKNAKKRRGQNGPVVSDLTESSKKLERTSERVADENGIGVNTVKRCQNYARGLDIADDISPGIRSDILNGKIKASSNIIESLVNKNKDVQKDVVNAIKDGDSKKANKILSSKTSDPHSLKEGGTYDMDDLVNDYKAFYDDFYDKTYKILYDHLDVINSYDTGLELLKALCDVEKSENDIGRDISHNILDYIKNNYLYKDSN